MVSEVNIKLENEILKKFINQIYYFFSINEKVIVVGNISGMNKKSIFKYITSLLFCA